MDSEGQDVPFLQPLQGRIDTVKVFPFIIHLKRDVIVSRQTIRILDFSLTFFPFIPDFPIFCVVR